jgi:hypothetical protein
VSTNDDCKRDRASNLTTWNENHYCSSCIALLLKSPPDWRRRPATKIAKEPALLPEIVASVSRTTTFKPSVVSTSGIVADSFETASPHPESTLQQSTAEPVAPRAPLYDPAVLTTYHVPTSQPPTPATKDAIESLAALNAYTASTAKKRKHSETVCDQTVDINRRRDSALHDEALQRRQRQQHIANSVHFLKPSQIQGDWDVVFGDMRSVVNELFQDLNINLKEPVKFASMRGRTDPLWQLYRETLGDDRWHFFSLQGSLKANNVLLALVGRVVQHIMTEERNEAWYSEWRSESGTLLYAALRETLSAQGKILHFSGRDHDWDSFKRSVS